MRADRGVHLHRHLGPGLAGQRDPPVDSRSPAARVALRHLPHATSVLLQLRSISFCKFLASGQSPSCTALKILPRSRRTCSSWCRQSTRSQASPSNGGRPSGPFTEVSNLPVSSGIYARFRLKGSPAHVSALAGPSIKLAIRPVIRAPSGRRPGPAALAFPLPFGRRRSLPGHPVPPAGFRPSYDRPTGRPAHTRACRTDPGEVSTFRTRETQTGPGALFTPGTAVSAGHRVIRGRRLPPLNGRFLPSRHSHPARDVDVTRHQQGFPDSRPIPVLPLACGRHGWSGGPWAFP
jgi:hypothetical protein